MDRMDPPRAMEESEKLMLNALRLEMLSREAQRTLERLRESNDPMAEAFEKTLKISANLAQEIKQMASGETLRRSRPMREALQRACASGALADWEEGLEALAHKALESSCPRYVAAAILDAVWDSAPPGAALARLIGSIEQERSLGAPGYQWEWGDQPDQIAAKARWETAVSIAARHGRSAPSNR